MHSEFRKLHCFVPPAAAGQQITRSCLHCCAQLLTPALMPAAALDFPMQPGEVSEGAGGSATEAAAECAERWRRGHEHEHKHEHDGWWGRPKVEWPSHVTVRARRGRQHGHGRGAGEEQEVSYAAASCSCCSESAGCITSVLQQVGQPYYLVLCRSQCSSGRTCST